MVFGNELDDQPVNDVVADVFEKIPIVGDDIKDVTEKEILELEEKINPEPVITSPSSLFITIIIASSRRRNLSVRQSLANSIAARFICPECCPNFSSKRSIKVKASAVEPANPAITVPSDTFRTFLTLLFITTLPNVACPSAPNTALPLWIIPRTVVERIFKSDTIPKAMTIVTSKEIKDFAKILVAHFA